MYDTVCHAISIYRDTAVIHRVLRNSPRHGNTREVMDTRKVTTFPTSTATLCAWARIFYGTIVLL